MKRLLILFVLAVVLISPSMVSDTPTDLNYQAQPMPNFMLSALGTEDYVDALSDLHTPSDMGTHSSFAEEQDFDSVFDILTESDYGTSATNYEDFVDAISDLHIADADVGTHSSFAEMQDKDSVYDTLTEGNTGGTPSALFYGAGSGAAGITTTIAPSMPSSEAAGYLYLCHIMVLGTTVGVTSVATSDPLTFTLGFGPYTSGTDGRIWVYYAYSDGSEASTVTVTTGAGTVGRFARVYMFYRVHTTWASAYQSLAFNSLGSVSTIVDTGVTSTGIASLAVNFVAVGEDANTYTAFTGETGGDWTEPVTQYSDAAGDDGTLQMQTASIGVGTINGGSYAMGAADPACVLGFVLRPVTTVNYDMDLEVGWTSAPYSETNEYLCWYAGTLDNDEAIRVDIWNSVGSAWVNLFSIDATGSSSWHNITISSYLNDATVEVRFTDTSDDSTTQDAWQVEGVLLHCWTAAAPNYRLDLEVGWTTTDYDENNEYLCIYAGTQDAEALQVDIWTGSWTNIIADISAIIGWNNVSISSYLTDATVEIRFIDTTQSSDSSQGTWEVEAVLIHTWTANNVPVNDTSPTCADLDDTTYLYAEYEEYAIIVYVSDGDGYADIDYIDLYLYESTHTTNYWIMRYDEDTNTFAEQSDASNYVEMSGSSASRTGNDIDATFQIRLHWNHPDLSNIAFRVIVYDDNPESDDDYFDMTWDTETRVDYQTSPKLEDASGTLDRGDIGAIDEITASGDIKYYGSASNIAPISTEVDIWIVCTDVAGSPWGGDLTILIGSWSTTVDSDDVVGLDTYTFKVVEEGAGSGGTDLYYTTSFTDTYIADRIQVQSYTPSDTRDNINDDVTIDALLWYDYDNSAMTTGTVTIEGYSASHIGAGSWRITRTSATVTSATYDTVVASDTTNGMNTVDQNGQTTTVTWDQVLVQSYTRSDDRDDINDDVTIDVLLWLDYDDSLITSGTVTINGISASHLGSGVWRITENYGTVGLHTYDTVACIDGTYSITYVNQNGLSTTAIWDRVQAQSIITSDSRDEINSGVTITLILWLDYDDTVLNSGTVTIEGVTATYVSGTWKLYDETSATVQAIIYDTVACSGNYYGITEVDMNGKSVTVIWDRIQVQSYTPSDSRDNINDNVNIDVLLWYDYDNTLVTTGSFTINGYTASHQGSGVWRITRTSSTVIMVTYDTVAGVDSVYIISVVDQNSQDADVIWDRVQVQSYTSSDDRDDIGDTITLNVTIVYDYDNTPVIDGVVTVNGISTTHVGFGIWQFTDNEATVSANTYNTVACSGNTYGITSIDQNGQSKTVIWDRIVIVYTGASDYVVPINHVEAVIVTAYLDYDNTYLGSGDSVTLDDEAMVWIEARSRFELDRTQTTVGKWYYFVNSTSEATYGITEWYINGKICDIIWDRVQVTGYSVSDSRDNVGDDVTIDVTLIYDYGDPWFTTGGVTINGLAASHIGSGVWRVTDNKASVQQFTYDTVATNGNDVYGINVVDQNGQSTSVIWDRIQVTGLAYGGDSHVDNGTVLWFNFTLIYDYDDSQVTTGTITVNSMTLTHYGSGLWGNYTDMNGACDDFDITIIVCSGTTYNITEVDMNGNTATLIWDCIIVTGYSVSDSRDNIGENVYIDVTIIYGYGSTPLTSGTVTIEGISASHIGSGVWRITENKPTVQMVTYDTVGVTETYGLTNIYQSGQSTSVIWDRIIVVSYSSDDNRIDIGTLSSCYVMLYYDYDDTYVENGWVLPYTGLYAHYHSDIKKWHFGETFGNVGDRLYNNLAAGGGNTYGIYEVYQNFQSITQIWDIVVVSMNINICWTIVGYNATVSYSGTYDYDDTLWSGEAEVEGMGQYPTYYTIGNHTVTATSITDPLYGLTEFTSNTVWCVWDDIDFSSLGYFWLQYSEYQVWLYLDIGTVYWGFNSTQVNNEPPTTIQTYTNDTADDWAVVYNGGLGEMMVGSFTSSWYYLNLTVMTEITIDGLLYNWTQWSYVLTVDVLHSIYIVDSEISMGDEYITIGLISNMGNGTITVWDQSLSNVTPIYYQAYEGWCQIPISDIFCLHNLTILINATHSGDSWVGNVQDWSESYYWKWFQFPYTPSIEYSVFIFLHDSEGWGIDWYTCRIYYNEERWPTNEITVYGTNILENLTITTYFDEVIAWLYDLQLNETMTVIDVEVVAYRLTIVGEGSILLNMTSSSNSTQFYTFTGTGDIIIKGNATYGWEAWNDYGDSVERTSSSGNIVIYERQSMVLSHNRVAPSSDTGGGGALQVSYVFSLFGTVAGAILSGVSVYRLVESRDNRDTDKKIDEIHRELINDRKTQLNKRNKHD